MSPGDRQDEITHPTGGLVAWPSWPVLNINSQWSVKLFKPFNGCKHIIVVLSYRRIILLLWWIPTPYFYESLCWLYSPHGAICILKMLKCMHICLKLKINWIYRSAKPGQILGRSKIVNHYTLERSPKPWWKKINQLHFFLILRKCPRKYIRREHSL